MQSLTEPVSHLIRSKNESDDTGDGPKRKTREEWKKDKELEEARKLGTVPAAVDEEGKDINPHIPQYISQVPWYFGNLHPTLKHQRVQSEKEVSYSKIDEWYKRGTDTIGSVTVKFRKGACDNCGAMTHKRKDCLERPRKIGARFTGAAVAPDEKSQPSLSLGFDGKRDRWNGYDPAEYSQVIEEHRKVEDAKRQLKVSRLNAASTSAEATARNDGSDSDDEKYAEGFDMPGTKVDSKQRITVRNLRIREDTAKYLRNLALDSAYYDPKTRSMRENPYEGKVKKDVDYKGENFERYTGDTARHARTQLFSWEAQKNGVDVHVLSDPTRLELLQNEYESNRDDLEGSAKNSLIGRYGGQEHLESLPRELLLAQTENYVEYSRQGKVIKGVELTVARSQYEEDVYVNNHTSVWGSYWHDGVWGYKCCHNSVKNSYCTGEAGRDAAASDPITAPITMPGQQHADQDNQQQQLDDEEARKARKLERRRKKAEKKQRRKLKKQRRDKQQSESDESAESQDEEEVRKRKVAQAMMEQLAEEAHAKRLIAMDERKRPYNSMANISEPTAEEMEAWRMRQMRQDDPMANFTTDC